MRSRRILSLFLVVVAAGMTSSEIWASPGRFMTTDEFLGQAFATTTCGAAPVANSLIVSQELRASIEAAFDRRFSPLKVKYWSAGPTSAWIFDEIGRTEPITIGIAVTDGKVDLVRVLVYRESRGYEVRQPHFTEQFAGAELSGASSLDRHVDGITGATLSVRAVNRAVELALFLAARLQQSDGTMAYARECPGAAEP